MSPQEISYWFTSEVKPHEQALRGYLHGRVAQPADVDDIVQETYRRIVEVQRRQPIRSTKGLLFTIAKNLQRDELRKKQVASAYGSETEMEQMNIADFVEEPDETAAREDEIAVLRAAISSLPPRCRKILILRKYENLSQKEIAARLGISVHTVETQLTRGLKKCQRHFARHGLMDNKEYAHD